MNTQNTNYTIKQISTGCLSQFAYYIESNKEACIIDPMREPDQVLNYLKENDAKLKYIFETHFHADFVSGHLELNKLTGASSDIPLPVPYPAHRQRLWSPCSALSQSVLPRYADPAVPHSQNTSPALVRLHNGHA